LKISVGAHGEKKQIFVLNLDLQAHTTMGAIISHFLCFQLGKITPTAAHVFIDLKINPPVLDFWGFESFLQF